MPAERTTLPHFSVSLRRKRANSSGELPTASVPSAASRSLMAALCSVPFIASFSLLTISRGVFAGANNPYHCTAS